VGEPLEIYHYPKNLFVASFIGSPAMNFLPAVIEREDDTWYVKTQAFRLPIPPERAARFTRLGEYVNKEVIFGIRPENMEDAALDRSTPPEWSFEALVEVKEPMGAEMYVYLSVGDRSIIARVDPNSKAQDGKMHRITIDMSQAHLFDKDTEEAIT